MKENTKEKSVVKTNENNFWGKIKTFLRNIFHKDEENTAEENKKISQENHKSSCVNDSNFIEDIRNIESEETKLLRLQKEYRSGKIKEEDMTNEQISALCALYDKQIADLRKSNEERKQRLRDYKNKMGHSI